MAQQKQTNESSKKCKKKRISGAKLSKYINFSKPRNMLKRAVRVYKRVTRLTQNPELALQQAQKCASAHGVIVEAAFARWKRGETPFQN